MWTSHWEMVPRFGFQESNFKYSENFFCPSHANLFLVNTVHCISVLNLTIFTTGKLADYCVWRDLWNNYKECFNLYPNTEKWVKKNKADLSDWYSLSNNRNSREKLKWGFTKVFVISIQFVKPFRHDGGVGDFLWKEILLVYLFNEEIMWLNVIQRCYSL